MRSGSSRAIVKNYFHVLQVMLMQQVMQQWSSLTEVLKDVVFREAFLPWVLSVRHQKILNVRVPSLIMGTCK